MKRNKFSLSHYKLMSMNMGNLVPCGLFEVLPGDTIQHSTSALVRASPLIAPVMHPVHVRIHHWYVPLRLIWNEFEDFITGGPAGTSVPAPPTFSATWTLGSLSDYFGLPIGTALTHSCLPFRAYALIWNEWYRDQDLQTELPIAMTSGNDGGTSSTLQNCAWEKDYFTSSRPWEQKGPAITIPLGSTAPVESSGVQMQFRNSASTGTAALHYESSLAEPVMGATAAGTMVDESTLFYNAGLQTNLSTASAITVTALREALALQRFEEARARYGSRYTEYLRYLGVRSSDARLQRPEYLGGGKQTIQFSEVLQTAEGTDPVGSLKGHGIGAMRSNRYRRFIEEHGLVISLMSVKPKTMYMQGQHRMWNRTSKEDYWQKELEHIGQQEVLNKEIYAAGASPTGVFGYQDRYDEYRGMESGVSGEFRNSTLNFWHLAREFSSAPALNADFVKCVPTERVFAVNSQDVLYVMANHSIQARRKVSSSGHSFIF